MVSICKWCSAENIFSLVHNCAFTMKSYSLVAYKNVETSFIIFINQTTRHTGLVLCYKIKSPHTLTLHFLINPKPFLTIFFFQVKARATFGAFPALTTLASIILRVIWKAHLTIIAGLSILWTIFALLDLAVCAIRVKLEIIF